MNTGIAGLAASSPTAGYVLSVNGAEHRIVEGWVGESLLYVLRERLELPGSKNACEEGECGSCSVLLDGALVCSCLVLAASAEGREVSTVEGLDRHDAEPGESELSDVQQAFVDAGAVQCGFCTPGFVTACTAHIRTHPNASPAEMKRALGGNLCRCGTYAGMILAATDAAKATGGA